MDDETSSFDVQKINASEPINGLGHAIHGDTEKKHERQQPHLKKDARDYFHTLSKAAEASNALLTRKGLPYRFHVYQEDNEIFIDLVALDNKGKILEEKRKNISHDDFARLMEDVSQIEGLLFDGTA